MNGHGALNRIYRVVWNAALGVWQVASEITKGKGKTKSQRTARKGLASIGAGSILLLCHAGAMATLPTGGAISAGNGNISQNGSTMVIDQSSNKLAIDWQSFNVGAGNTVQFNQPSANAVALNRVMGGDPSVIHGAINANGRVFLLNPNGILFGATSKIEVASLLASTMNLSNEDFMAGNYRFEGNSDKGIVNQGQIKAADGGFIAMVAAKIENVGAMQVRDGQIVMGSGSKVRLDLGGPVKIEIDEAVIDGYIRNAGMIRADGGTVLMTVKTAGEIASMAINNEGIIQARGLETGDGGSIRLLGDGGIVSNSGTLDVSADNGKGGYVEVTGKRVGMLDGAVVDASGAQGGGTILLGGDYQGKNADVANARMTYIAEQAVIRANALKKGHGGKIIAWADDSTLYFGKMEAKGGAESGNGGFVEVSGKQYLDFQGKVDTSAANGSNGTLLLDPTNLTIGNVASSTWITDRDNIFRDFTDADDELNVAHDFSFLRVDVLLAALANNDITVMSACDAANCAGNITVIDAITWNSGKALTLNATGSVTIDAAITSTGAAGVKGGDFNVIAGTAGTGGADGIPGDIVINANITTHGGAGQAGGNVNLSTVNGSITLNDSAVISTAGSAAQAGSDANGGAGGNIALTSTIGIDLKSGQLLSTGGAADGSGVDGNGGRITLTSTTGDISQSGGRLVARELVADAGNGSINLNTGANSIERLAAQSTAGNIHFANQNTAGLTVTDIDGVSGVNTDGAGNINLSARNFLVESDITADAGSIALNANHGQQSGDFTGVHILEANVTTKNGDITISGRGGDAEHGSQNGVQISKSIVSAGGSGKVTVTGVGGTNAGEGNEGVLIQGNGIANSDSSMITSEGGQITVNASGGAGDGGGNFAVAFNHGGQIGAKTGNRNVLIKTVLGGSTHDAYASDPLGGYIGTGTGNLTLEGNVVNASGGSGGAAPVSVRSTGDLKVQSVVGASFDGTFNLSEFAQDFVFNGSPSGLNDVRSLTIGREGNTSDIQMNQALDMNGGSITLTGGNINLAQGIVAETLNATASGSINQSETHGSFTLGSANLTSTGGDITLKGTGNAVDSLAATATGAITFDNGDNALDLNGTLSGASVHLHAGSIQQNWGTITAGALEVTSSSGDVNLNKSNKVGTLAADVKGDFTFGNGGSNDVLTVGTVGETTGLTSTGSVTFNNIRDLEITEGVSATGVTINAGSRNIDLGSETDGAKLSLTDAEIDRITAASLTLTTSGNVVNSADVRAGAISAMTITAVEGITRSGSGVLGFSHIDNGALTLSSTGTADGQGIGTADSTSGRLVTVGASELTLSSARDIHVDARTRAGGSGSANLAKLHINSTSGAASGIGYSVLSTAELNLGRTGLATTWHEAVPKGTYTVSLNNVSNDLDFSFTGNAPIQVNASSIGAADFALQTTYGINVASNIAGSSGAINLKAGGSNGNYKGISLDGRSITTVNGSITLDGKGGNGQNAGEDSDRTRSDQFGVWIAGGGSVRADGTGTVDITGKGGSTSSNYQTGQYGGNSDGVVITGANSRVEANGGNIAISGTGGTGSHDSSATSDGIVLASGGAITNASGSVKLTGTATSGINNVPARAIDQSSTAGIITAAGLEVLTTSGWAYLTNNNNVGTLAGDVRSGFYFDNGGNNLTIGTVNGRAGFSDTSTSEIGLYDINALTVDESIEMASGTLKIAANTVSIADDKRIGDRASNSSRSVKVRLTGRSDNDTAPNRDIDIGTNSANTLAFTGALLDKIHANELELATAGTISVTADTEFKHVNQLTLTSTGAISNAAAHYLLLSDTDNQGTLTLNGGSAGTLANAIRVRGANRLNVNSPGQFNVEAYTDDTSKTDLVDLHSVSINSTSGGSNLTYRILGGGLNYSATGGGSSYNVNANATRIVSGTGALDDPYVYAPVDFSFTGNAGISINADSDLMGGALNVRATSGAITALNNVAIASGSASFWAAGNVTFSPGTSLNAKGNVTFRSDNAGGTFATGTGSSIASTGKIDIRADNVTLGTGTTLITPGTVEVNQTTGTRTIQLGGASDGAGLSLTAAELGMISADTLIVGRNSSVETTSGEIQFTGATNLTNISNLILRSRSGSIAQDNGATLGVNNLTISSNTGNISMNQSGNTIRNFTGNTNGTIAVNNTGALDVKGASSNGKAIAVTSSGNLLVSGAVNATANTTGAQVGGGAITLTSSGGNLTVLGGITSNGYSSSSNSRQTGGTITLAGRNVELGAVTIQSRGSSNSGNGAVGGNAGTISIDATAVGGTVTLDGTMITLTGGNGGSGANSGAGEGKDFTLSDAVVLTSLSGSTTPSTVTINAGGGTVTLASVNGGVDVANNLTITSVRTGTTTSSYGDVTIGAIGGTHAIGKLTLGNTLTNQYVGDVTLLDVKAAGIAITNTATNSTGTTNLNGNLRTNGADGININSKSIVLASGKGYTTENGGNIKLATQDILNLTDTSAFNSSGNIDLKADGGIRLSGAGLQTTGSSIIFQSATTLTSDMSIDTTGDEGAGGNVEFRNTLDSTNGAAHTLTIAAGTGSVKFDGAVGSATATSQLGAVAIDSAKDVSTSSGFKAASFTQNAGSGTTTIGGAMTLDDGAFGFTGNALTVNGALTASAVTVNNAGLFSTGAGSSITAAGGFTQAGSDPDPELNTGTVKLGGGITTTGTDITFASPVTVNGTVALSTGATGAGDIRFAGALDNASSAYSGSTTLTAGAGDIVFGGDIGANTALGNLAINSSQDVTLPVSVTANSLTTNAGGSTILQDGAVITTSGAQTYGDAVTLAGNATVASNGSGAITFLNTVNGAHTLAVNTNGTTTFGGAVGNTTALTSLATDAGGTTVFNGGAVTTSGSQTYRNDVQLGVDTILSSTNGGAITFNGTVDSAGDVRSLQVNTSGTTTFGGAIGDDQELASITVSNPAGTLLINGGSIATAGAQTYHSGTIILGGDTTLRSGGTGVDGNITLNGDIDAAICTVASLDVLTQGATIFGGAIGTYRPLWSVTTDGAPSDDNTVTFEQGTVITLGNQTYGETVILGTDTKLTSLGQGTITFEGPVRAAVDGQQSLTVDTSGDIVFNGEVGDNDQRLASLDTGESIDGTVWINGGGVNTAGTQVYRQQVELGNNAILTGTTGTFDVGIKGNNQNLTLSFSGPTDLEGEKFTGVRNLASDGDGVTNVTGTIATSGTQAYTSDMVLGSDVVLQSTGIGAAGNITLGKADGAHALRIETAGTTNLAGTVGGTTALSSLTTDGPGTTTISGGSVTTTGAQTYGDTVQMTANATLTSTGGGDIVFEDEVEGPRGLTVNTGGVTRFDGNVGGTTALASLTTDAGGSVEINGGSVTTIGAQTYGDAVKLGADTTLASIDGGNITFAGMLDGAHALTVNTDGTTRFGGEVGGTTALASLTTDGPGATVISGGKVTTTGAQTYGDAVTLATNTVLTSEDDADIVFSDTVDGGGALTVNTGGTTRFNGEVGGDTALASLTTDAGGSVEINGGGVKTTGTQTYGDAVTLGADTSFETTGNGNIVFGGTVDGAHDMTVDTGGTTRFNAAVGGTTALANLTTRGTGSVAINGGRVNTSGDQHYGNAVTLGANAVLASSSHGDITFDRTLDGAHALAVETDGDTVFNGAVGGRTALASLTTDAGGNAVINGGSVRTTGAQTFNDGVMVGANTVFSSNGPITFVDTLDGPWNIKVQTPGVTTFGGAIGSIAPVANLTGGAGRGTINILGPSINLSGSLTFEETVYVKNPTTVDVGGDALFYGDAREGKSLLDATAGGRIQFGRPIDNLKAYLPALFTERNAGQPANRHLADNTTGRQLSFGRLELVNVNVGGASVGNAGGMQIDEGVVDGTVGRIAAGNHANRAGAQTYVVTVNGGVRPPVAGEVQEEKGADQAI